MTPNTTEQMKIEKKTQDIGTGSNRHPQSNRDQIASRESSRNRGGHGQMRQKRWTNKDNIQIEAHQETEHGKSRTNALPRIKKVQTENGELTGLI